jgi:hypothetical protein
MRKVLDGFKGNDNVDCSVLDPVESRGITEHK